MLSKLSINNNISQKLDFELVYIHDLLSLVWNLKWPVNIICSTSGKVLLP